VLVPHNVQMRFDWTDLRVFLYACDTGSMTEAASCSNLTLAAVSSRIRGLEESIGILLLRRHARGVVATAAGEALARHARLLFHQLDALRRDVAPSGPLGIANTVVLANSSAMARPLSRAVAERLGADPLVLIASPEHVLARRDAIHFEEALSYDWVGWGEASALHTHLLIRAYQAGVALKGESERPFCRRRSRACRARLRCKRASAGVVAPTRSRPTNCDRGGG